MSTKDFHWFRAAGARTYLRELAFRDFYADVLHHRPASAPVSVRMASKALFQLRHALAGR
ncbi:hypothetical protein MAHJHV63_55190 [Mycobacterium avium subsp. hominissuis]